MADDEDRCQYRQVVSFGGAWKPSRLFADIRQ